MLVSLAATGCLLGACTTSVHVDPRFPTPLVEPLPIRMGIVFDNALTQYVYHEDLPSQPKWDIELGDANVAMFSQIFSSMFMSAQPVSSVAAPGTTNLDGILQPELQKFEFNAPPETEKEERFAEVWLQFQLTLYRPDGTVVAKWPVSGYGKAELADTKQDAVNQAAIVALRDIGAAISTQFAKQPDIRNWLQDRQNARLSASVRLPSPTSSPTSPSGSATATH